MTSRMVAGSQTYKDASTTLNLRTFTLGTGGKKGAELVPLYKAVPSARSQKETADRRGFPSHGHWSHFTFSDTPNIVLDLRLRKTTANVMRTSCSLILLLSEAAPLINVQINTTRSDGNARHAVLSVFHGRAFTLDVEMARSLGVPISRSEEGNFYDPEEVADEYLIEVIEVGREAAPTIHQTDSGEVVVMAKPTMRRSVRITRNTD